ncbi:FAD synthase-like isoform X2 [Thrips palmi]|uniref:FAD synthase n=1 Tax=Thrips palmi TaxID=161013 RepID=A0A6P8ZXR1_THRPL|nr:FAD synthase-like isoform X2 [Thrips palmi]
MLDSRPLLTSSMASATVSRCWSSAALGWSDSGARRESMVAVAQAARTAGLVVVGDEVLSGAVPDTNSHFVSQRLHRLGVRLLKVVVVPDDVEAVANEIREFSGRYDVVLTSGGVGPTHDDKTYEAVARAFRLPLRFNAEVAKMVAAAHGLGLGGQPSESDVMLHPVLKMALVPAECRLHRILDTHDTTITKPIIQVRNVFVFPGSPANLRRAFAQLEGDIRGSTAVRFHCREVYLNVEEPLIVQPLNLAVEKFKGSVAFGSYPNCGGWRFPTKLTLESTSWETLHAATEFLLEQLPPSCVEGLSAVPMEDLLQFAESTPDLAFGKCLRETIQVLTECCNRYHPDELVLCFNGGKDATVLLHLACAVIRHHHPEHAAKPLHAFWVQSAEPFPEVREFVSRMVEQYNLHLDEVPGPIKVGLRTYLGGKPEVKAALIGVRRTDPYSSKLSAFQETDLGWPAVMRVSPILEWRYADVWTFLRELHLPYCSLYDQGPTPRTMTRASIT